MKTSLSTLAVLMALCVSAHATNTPAPPPAPTPSPAPSTSTSAADAKAQADAKAAADARAAAIAKQKQQQAQAQKQAQAQRQAQAQNQTAKQDTKVDTKLDNVNAAAGGDGGTGTGGMSGASSDAALSNIGNSHDESKSSFKALALSLPSPVFTPPLPISGCPQANVDQSALSVAGGMLFSHAKGTVNTDNCTAIIIYNAFLAQCKYESAQQVLNSLTVKILPDWKPQNTVNIDLTTRECVELQKPIPPANPTKIVDNYIYVEKPAVACIEPPKTPAATPGKKPIKKAVKPALDSCKR